ncbi:sigma factor-like helix-turn-helix DNA-binding protein [Salegentibacter agarivorans]
MTIDEIYKKEEISVRSYHVCKYNDLHSVSDLKKYYHENKSFEKLRNCGKKSNVELIGICNRYQSENIENREVEIKNENPLKSIILNLTRVQREVVNSFILVNTNSLSVRSKNAISLHLKGNLKVKNFAEKILLSERFIVKNIKNIGAKCVPELEVYISIIKEFIFEVNESNDEKYLIALKNKFLIHQTFSIPLIPVEILESESIFLLTNFLLDKNALFDKTQTTIVKNAFKLYDNQEELTLDDIATKVDLSRERVRQIRKLCLEELLDKLMFIQNFNDDLFQKYSLDIASNFLEINLDVIKKINASNNTNLSVSFP